MKDILGRDIKVGDYVLHVYCISSSVGKLVAKVVRFTSQKVGITQKHDPMSKVV